MKFNGWSYNSPTSYKNYINAIHPLIMTPCNPPTNTDTLFHFCSSATTHRAPIELVHATALWNCNLLRQQQGDTLFLYFILTLPKWANQLHIRLPQLPSDSSLYERISTIWSGRNYAAQAPSSSVHSRSGRLLTCVTLGRSGYFTNMETR